MAHDVFISYSSRDKLVADAVCAKLEDQGIRCWVTPRDVLPGTEYGAALVKAIGACRIFVLIFSAQANLSPQVRREVERAVSKGKVILTFRIEDITPSEAMEYNLSNTHWLDALDPPLDAHIARLSETLRRLLDSDEAGEAGRNPLVETLARNAQRLGNQPPSHYDVFISAKSEDYPHARIAAAFLREAGLHVFYSEQELQEMGNSDYFDAIDTALECSRHMLVVTTSRAYVSSQWVKKEWQTYLNEKLSGRKAGNIVTLLCGGMKIGDLPLSLRQHEARPIDDLRSLLNYFKRQ